MHTHLRQATRDDIPSLWDMARGMGWQNEDDYFDKSMQYQDEGSRIVYILSVDGEDAGYCMLAWEPKYAFFKKLGIPEVQALNVLPEFRGRGYGHVFLEHCEAKAREEGKPYMGIGVGLDSSFGVAQRLYVKRGYMPDGHGITYDREPVQVGEFRSIDDQLCLMMVKKL